MRLPEVVRHGARTRVPPWSPASAPGRGRTSRAGCTNGQGRRCHLGGRLRAAKKAGMVTPHCEAEGLTLRGSRKEWCACAGLRRGLRCLLKIASITHLGSHDAPLRSRRGLDGSSFGHAAWITQCRAVLQGRAARGADKPGPDAPSTEPNSAGVRGRRASLHWARERLERRQPKIIYEIGNASL